MGRARPILTLPAIAILLLELALIGVSIQPHNQISLAQIYVYHNGYLVYHDNDPPVNNFPYMVASYFTGGYDYNPFQIYDLGGNVHKYITTNGNTYIWLIIDPSVTYSPNKYTLSEGQYIQIQIDPANYYVDANTFTIQASISYTYTNSTAGNVTIYGSAYICCNVMYFLDIFNNPITLKFNDTVTITYKFNMATG